MSNGIAQRGLIEYSPEYDPINATGLFGVKLIVDPEREAGRLYCDNPQSLVQGDLIIMRDMFQQAIDDCEANDD